MWESEGRGGRGSADREWVKVGEARRNQGAVTGSRGRERRERQKEEVDQGETV